MDKICESCGMPMRKPEEFGGGNIKNKYCVHCTYQNGDLKPWDEKLEDTTHFIMRTTDVPIESARKMAEENLKKFPAWKHIR